MPPDPYLHELDDFPALIQIVSDEKGIIPQLVEKDYWIMILLGSDPIHHNIPNQIIR